MAAASVRTRQASPTALASSTELATAPSASGRRFCSVLEPLEGQLLCFTEILF